MKLQLPITDIIPLIPQRAPFVMIGELVHASENTTVTRFTIPVDGVLVENGALSEHGMVENMAQTAAAGAGFRGAEGGSREASVGYIGALKSLQIIDLPRVGETIETTTTTLHTIGPATLVQATVRTALGEVLARCELKIFSAQH